jgi:hypothetical protein
MKTWVRIIGQTRTIINSAEAEGIVFNQGRIAILQVCLTPEPSSSTPPYSAKA